MEKNYDIIIIGGGIAGLTAALYAARAGQKTLIIEKNAEGGQILAATDIDNYPGSPAVSGFELIQKVAGQALDAGAVTAYDNAVAFDFSDEVKTVKTLGGEYSARAIIFAAGLVNNTLGLKNEKELTGSGVSYCATCDGAFFKGKTVMVAGGGRTARFDAEYLAPLAKKVYVLDNKKIEPFKEKNIELIEGAQVIELIGAPLEKVRLIKDKKEAVIETEGLFIAAGRSPSTHELKGLAELDIKGYVITGEDMSTNVPGLFAAGDVRKKTLRQLVTAASDGAVAAHSAVKYIKSLRKNSARN